MDGKALPYLANIDPHPTLGMMVSIWSIRQNTGIVTQKLSIAGADDSGLSAENPVRQLLEEALDYTEQRVLAHFAKKMKIKSLQEMQDDPQRRKMLEAYTDKWCSQWLERAVNLFRIFTTGIQRNGIIDSHLVQYFPLEEQLNLHFLKTDKELHYRLTLGDRSFTLLGRSLAILSRTPGWAILDRFLIHVPQTSAAILKPFTQKSEVVVPGHLIGDYMQKFILPMAEKANITAEGFDMVEVTDITKKRISLVEDVFSGKYQVRVDLAYGEVWFTIGDSREYLQRLAASTDGNYAICRHQRQPLAEAAIVDSLVDVHLDKTATGRMTFTDQTDAENTASVAHWLIRHHDSLRAQGWSVDSFFTPYGKLLPVMPDIRSSVSAFENDWFDMKATVVWGDIQVPFVRLAKYILDCSPFYPLGSGQCGLIPETWFMDWAEWFALGEIKEDRIRLTKAQYNSLQQHARKTEDLLEEILTPSFRKFPIPKGIHATLRPYQHIGFSWLASLYEDRLGGCLADDMGLGKTLQTITFLQHLKTHYCQERTEVVSGQLDLFAQLELTVPSSLRAVVIAPASLLFNWEREINRFAPGLRVIRHSGSTRPTTTDGWVQMDVVLTSYPVLIRDMDLFAIPEWQVVVMDESQQIKNRDSKTFHAVHQLRAHAKYSLTGTPVENSLADLWSLMHVVNPGLLGQFNPFRTHYIQPIQQKQDSSRQHALREIVRPYLLRRRKESVAKELPPLTEQIIYCEMLPEQEACYQKVIADVRVTLLQSLREKGKLESHIALTALMKLRQIAICPAMIPEYQDIPSAKTNLIQQELTDLLQSGHNALVFSAFLKHLKVHGTWLEADGYRYDTITGGDSDVDKNAAGIAFQNGEVPVLLMTIKAGGTGLNLTAAEYVLITDPWWNPAVEKQAIGRAHRIGQQKPVIAIRYITKGTIEEKILRLQERKQQWSDDLLSETAMPSGLTLEEWKELFDLEAETVALTVE